MTIIPCLLLSTLLHIALLCPFTFLISPELCFNQNLVVIFSWQIHSSSLILLLSMFRILYITDCLLLANSPPSFQHLQLPNSLIGNTCLSHPMILLIHVPHPCSGYHCGKDGIMTGMEGCIWVRGCNEKYYTQISQANVKISQRLKTY